MRPCRPRLRHGPPIKMCSRTGQEAEGPVRPCRPKSGHAELVGVEGAVPLLRPSALAHAHTTCLAMLEVGVRQGRGVVGGEAPL